MVKAIEATSAVKEGATEIDVVAFLPFLMNHDVDAARAELIEVVKAARAVRSDVIVKVIVESAALLKLGGDQGEGAIATACRPAPSPIVELWLGGDVHVGARSGDGLAPLAGVLASALGIVNLEGPVGDSPTPGEGIRLVNGPAGVAGLRAAGVRAIPW